jgi:magnesium chelatase family protein
MATRRSAAEIKELNDLLGLDHTLFGGILFGLDGYIIEIQARAVSVAPGFQSWREATTVSGMARGSIYEALDRITGAFAKLRVPDPQVNILVNLAPADLPKDGTWLDLPLAIILLQAAGLLPDLPQDRENQLILVGELGIHGEIRRVPVALSLAYVAKPGQKLIVPAGNEKECALILAKPGHEGCGVFPAATLSNVVDFFRGRGKLENALRNAVSFESHIPKSIDFGRIKGQERAKEAAVIAAAGGHNLLLIGPPGEGKSMLASAIPGILPRLTNAEKVELTRIYSAAGELKSDGVAVSLRPMRSIHHTASKPSIIGGGSGVPRPGEVTMAHLGVLFLDEIAEFSSSTLESLRQPIEDGTVSISRVGATLTFPSRFTLVAAMNPCPCGYYGTDACRCKDSDVKKYQKKLSGPILDRIDLQVELSRLTTDERFAEVKDGESDVLRNRIQAARDVQTRRYSSSATPFNAAMPGSHLREYCRFSSTGLERYKAVIDANTLTTRSVDRLGKVSRTVADLAGSEEIEAPHIDKAASFVIGGILRDAF